MQRRFFTKKEKKTEKCDMTSVNLEKNTVNILRSKKSYSLEISQSISYVKKYFYLFSLP